MSEVRRWEDTAAGMIANGGWVPDCDWTALEDERRTARVEFEAKLAADPAWARVRTAQQELAARGWTGQVITIEHIRLPELEPLFMAQKVSEARTGTWGPASDGGMTPTNDTAREIEQHSRAVHEKARLRQQAENVRLPPGSPTVSRKSRPEPGVSYAGGDHAFQLHSHGEAVRSLADYLGATEQRAAGLLEDGIAGVEIRNHRALSAQDEDQLLAEAGDPLAALRVMRRAYGRPWLPR